jgi:hypothetical protein
MQLTDYQFIYIPKWSIKSYDYFYFTTENKLYNSRTNRILKKRVKCSSVGYELDGKFITLKNLKPLLVKVKKQNTNIFDYMN